MRNELEYKMQNINLLSIKQSEGEIDIANSDLDKIFGKCVAQSNVIYFIGLRPLYNNEEVDLLMKQYLEVVHFDEVKSASIYKVSPCILIISRNGFKHIWERYEYPFLFFMNQESENENVGLLSGSFFIDELINKLRRTLVIYRSFELNVLWISKTNDTLFPNFRDI